MIVQWALLGRCEHSAGVTSHTVELEVARTLDPARITFADVDATPCPRTETHTVRVYDIEKP